MDKPIDEIQARLDELGVEHDTYDLPNGEHGVSWIDGNGIEWEAVQRGENFEIHALQLVTPEQAIAATVGRCTDLSKRLREVTGLHSFAELFGFSWEDGSDWTWHDVACAMADAVDATVGKDIEYYDGSGRRGTVAILQGGRKPEEVLFVRDEGGVTHYLPEGAGTCDGSFHKSSDLSSGRVPLYYCKDTNKSIFVEREAKVCPHCGGRIEESE